MITRFMRLSSARRPVVFDLPKITSVEIARNLRMTRPNCFAIR